MTVESQDACRCLNCCALIGSATGRLLCAKCDPPAEMHQRRRLLAMWWLGAPIVTMGLFAYVLALIVLTTPASAPTSAPAEHVAQWMTSRTAVPRVIFVDLGGGVSGTILDQHMTVENFGGRTAYCGSGDVGPARGIAMKPGSSFERDFAYPGFHCVVGEGLQ